MRGMFDSTRLNPAAIDRVKAIFMEAFNLSEDTLLSVAELRCHEPGCPPVETVVTARSGDGEVQNWRVHKPIKDIASDDVTALSRNS